MSFSALAPDAGASDAGYSNAGHFDAGYSSAGASDADRAATITRQNEVLYIAMESVMTACVVTNVFIL